MIPITMQKLRALAPKGDALIINALIDPLNDALPRYGITTPLRVAHFLAQAAHETDGFKTLEEYASGARYQGRKDLGNVYPGDGKRFKGRGIFQLTGRVNYDAYGKRLGVDLIRNPDRAMAPEICVRVACEYWKAKGLNAWADRDDCLEITRRINGGKNGLRSRRAYLAKAKKLFGGAPVPLPPPRPADPPVEEVPDAPIAAEPAKRWWESSTVLTAIGGFLASVLGALQSPYALGGLIVLVAAGATYWIIRERMKREPDAEPA